MLGNGSQGPESRVRISGSSCAAAAPALAVAGLPDDFHRACRRSLEGFVVRSILLCLARHEPHVGHAAHGAHVKLAVRLAVLHARLGGRGFTV